MKKLLLATSLAGSLVLVGCDDAQIKAALAQAQQVAVQTCGFLPTIQTVQNIVVATAYPAGTPVAVIANQVGDAICAAVMAKSVKPGSTGPAVRGVPVEGAWVRK